MLNAATGLIYVGNWLYYDPATGRFLSRGVNPGAPNPYVPWQGNPFGMIVGPLALLVLVRGKRKGGKVDQFLVVLIVALAVSLTVSSCSGGSDGTPTQPPSIPPVTPTSTATPEPTETKTPTRQPTDTATTSPTETQTPSETPTPPTACNIPVPVSYYAACKAKANDRQVCLDPHNEDPSLLLTQVLWSEGGGLSPQMGVNIMQTLHNRAYNAWNCTTGLSNCSNNKVWSNVNPNKRPWSSITSDEYTSLILYLASEPYTGTSGGKHPVYNGFEEPWDKKAIEDNALYSGWWSNYLAHTEEWLTTLPGTEPESAPISYRDTYGSTYRVSSPVNKRSVMFFCSTSTESENLRAQSVHYDIAEGRYQYYGTRAFIGCAP